MKPIKIFSLTALTLMFGASVVEAGSNANPNWNMNDVRNTTVNASQFHEHLFNEYVALAQLESDEGDTYAMAYYNQKALLAARGGTVIPTTMTERQGVPAATLKELSEARAALVRMLNDGGATKAPSKAARSLAMFDCWVEEQTEATNAKDTARCRDDFNVAMNDASSAVYAKAAPGHNTAAMPAPAPKAAMPATPEILTYTLYFDHNSVQLSNASMATQKDVSDYVKASGAKTVLVTGYTDTSGTNAYNQALAHKRAMVVSDAIAGSGIKPIIDIESHGENQLAVQTDNNTRNWQNRRVVVRVQ